MPGTNIEKMEVRAREARAVRKIVLVITVAFGVLFLSACIGGYFYISHALAPVDPDSDKKKVVEIPLGSTVAEIAAILEKEGVIHSATIFRYYVRYKNESGFQAGTYQLSPSMSVSEIIAALKKGKVYKQPVFRMTIPEGLWMTDIAAIIAEKTGLSKGDILKKMKDRQYVRNHFYDEYDFLTSEIFNEKIIYPLEGYLFPATYAFYENDPSLETVISKMLAKTGEVLKKVNIKQEKGKMSIHEVLTLASLIEEEATKKADRKKISSVFYNRMEEGMLLQFDPTVKYALQSKEPLSKQDLRVDSPYNTYRYKGLPPGPIANPGLSSIKAALHPANTEYKYFFARVNGQVLFSKTYEEHLRIVRKYDDEWERYFKKRKQNTAS